MKKIFRNGTKGMIEKMGDAAKIEQIALSNWHSSQTKDMQIWQNRNDALNISAKIILPKQDSALYVIIFYEDNNSVHTYSAKTLTDAAKLGNSFMNKER
jgi:hypothetical protein